MLQIFKKNIFSTYLLWRIISDRITPHATETLSALILPCGGMLIISWQRFLVPGLIPFPSLPSTRTMPLFQSKSYKSVFPSPAVPIIQYPFSLRVSSVLPKFITLTTGMCMQAPDDRFITLCVIPADRSFGRIIPCAPKKTADRMIAPRLPSSVIWSTAIIRWCPSSFFKELITGRLQNF